jgi:gamma-glutamylaminecyclotransferase
VTCKMSQTELLPIVPSPTDAINLLQISSEHRLRSENLPFDIDVWYPLIEQFTFPTMFIPLTVSEAYAIVHYQDTRFNKRLRLTVQDVKILRNLEKRIDNVLKKSTFSSGAFLRLCGRSPKDADPLDRSQVLAKYKKDLTDLLENGAPEGANTKLRAIAKSNYLCVHSGAEAMNLLLTSERVFTDLHDWIRYGEPEQVVLRQWQPGMSLEYEFRAYVNNDRINAISQYDHYCVYPDLPAKKDMIQEMIFELWNIVHPHVGESSYVIDFAYLPDEHRMIVIELSPFRTCTGAALFSWHEDKDILENGPFEFRIKTVEHAYIHELVQTNWEDRWQREHERYDKIYANYEELEKGWMSSLYHWISSFFISEHRTMLFVYGTLKAGFHWHNKFLSQAKFVSKSTTVDPLALVVGDSGVPYLLLNIQGGKYVRGEIWSVNDESLKGLDEYEGVGKGYYCRKTIRVTHDNSIIEADAYFKIDAGTLQNKPFLDEYTLEFHKSHYKSIKHIQVKQLQYLGEGNERT